MNQRMLLGINRRIKKLEAAAGKGRQHCPYCRLHFRRGILVEPDHPLPPVGDTFMKRCRLCHSCYLFSLAGVAEPYRELYRRRSLLTLEDMYKDPSAGVLELWWQRRFGRRQARWPAGPENREKSDRRARDYAKLKEEVKRLTRLRERQLKAKYGRFSMQALRDKMWSIGKRPSRAREVGVSVSELAELEREETGHLIYAEMETIIRGGPFPETTAALEDVRRRISEAIEAARQDEARRKDDIRRHEVKAYQSANQERETGARWVDDPRFQMARVDE